MVRFGGHIEALSHGDLHSLDAYLVPYNQIKGLIFEEPGQFEAAWHRALKSAEDNFRTDRKELWQSVFDKIASVAEAEDVRGSHPGHALQLFVDNTHPDIARESLVRMRQIYQTGSANSEALRKLVKKYDKHVGGLSKTLLPTLYTSSLYAGQQMLQSSIVLLRDLVNESAADFQPLFKTNSATRHDRSAQVRMEEIDWLKRLVIAVDRGSPGLMDHLVAHRGFHHIQDRNDKRPLENSLSAYEVAWTSGVRLCECDIALTKDEKLVLAHDVNFMRLALDSKSPSSKRFVSDLTFRELLGLHLKSGIRPPLLIDVLRSASAISPDSKLVIEIKPGNQSAASALARLLIRHPDLRPSVAMIMSFDAITMHRLRAELSVLEDCADPISASKHHSSGTMHHRVNSFDHFGTMTMLGSLSRMNNYFDSQQPSIGLSLSTANLESMDMAASPSTQRFHDPPAHPLVQSSSRDHSIPKLMLLTVAQEPNNPCEHRVSVDDLSHVESWLKRPDGQLDGVYLQFEEKMMTPEGALHLKELSQRWLVGIWAYSGLDPDDFESFSWLVNEAKCSYVNTDLPNHFRKDIFVRQSSSVEEH